MHNNSVTFYPDSLTYPENCDTIRIGKNPDSLSYPKNRELSEKIGGVNMFNNNETNQFQQPVQEFESSVSGVENVTKKKKGKKIAIISGISAAVVAGGCAAAYNFSPLVKNQVKLRVMKPAKYYAWVSEENADTLAKSIADSYRKALDSYENGTTESYALEYETTDEAKDALLRKLAGSSYKDSDDEDVQQLVKVVNNIEKLKVGIDVSSKKSTAAYSIYGDLNDETLISADFVGDFNAMDVFFRVPQLTERYIGISLDEYMDDMDEEAAEVYGIVKDILDDPASYLSPNELEKEIKKYIGVWNDSIKRVKLEKSEEIDIADIEVKYTVATVKIDKDMAYEIIESFLDEMKDDDIIRDLVVEKLDAASDKEYDKFFDKALEELNDELYGDDEDEDYDDDDEDYDDDEDLDKDSDDNEVIIYKTYIDATGIIRGVSVETDDGSDDENIIKCIFGKDDSKVRGEFTVVEDGNEQFRAELKATEDGKDKYDGSIDVTVHDYDYDWDDETDEMIVADDEATNLSVEFEDFKIVNKDKCYMDGEVTFVIPDIDPITIELSSDGKSQRIGYQIQIDGKDYGKVSLILSSEDSFKADIPSKDDAFMIEGDFGDLDITEYVSEDDMISFVSGIMEKLGFEDDLIEEALNEITYNI